MLALPGAPYPGSSEDVVPEVGGVPDLQAVPGAAQRVYARNVRVRHTLLLLLPRGGRVQMCAARLELRPPPPLLAIASSTSRLFRSSWLPTNTLYFCVDL